MENGALQSGEIATCNCNQTEVLQGGIAIGAYFFGDISLVLALEFFNKPSLYLFVKFTPYKRSGI